MPPLHPTRPQVSGRADEPNAHAAVAAADHVGPAAVAWATTGAAALRSVAGLDPAIAADGVELALVLGSGLGPLADEIDGAVSLPYADVPGMPVSTAPGHAGRFVLGRLAGRRVIAMQGRLHAYEGHRAATCAFPVRVMRALGATRLVVTNACGGLDPHWQAGDLMLQLDFINHTFDHALTGPPDGVGPRFPVTFDAYDPEFLEVARRAARRLDLRLREGVYLAIAGPAYATRAELRAFRAWGADAVGMSTVHEVTVARSLGMRVLGLSVVTDMALPDGHAHASGDEVLRMATAAGDRFRSLVRSLLPEL
jgi:purine-nucleoside phosphorylase